MELLEQKGAEVDYHDPYVPRLHPTRDYDFQKASVDLTPETAASSDLALICTDHSDVDYDLLHDHAPLIVDTRNVYEEPGMQNGKVFKA
jgi:UDP-N-acetyl-D-glucosamine dehydrogenase